MEIGRHQSTVRVGPAGWSYRDWEGVVYPPRRKGFDPLEMLSRTFDTIEINSSYYHTPPVQHARAWTRRVSSNDRFLFTVKLHRSFTHDRNATRGELRNFRAFLDVMEAEGRLGCILIQFPWSFRYEPESLQWIVKVLDAFAAYPRAVEVRNSEFDNGAFRDLLAEHGAGFVNIDQPSLHRSIEPSAVALSGIGYVRFHGRNFEKWFNHDEVWERYDYLYSHEELAPWVDRIGLIAARSENVFVIMNNHFRGQAIVNGLDLLRALGRRPEIPPHLRISWGERAGE